MTDTGTLEFPAFFSMNRKPRKIPEQEVALRIKHYKYRENPFYKNDRIYAEMNQCDFF
jgi:hypothetical protein